MPLIVLAMTFRSQPQEVRQRRLGTAIAANFLLGIVFPGPLVASEDSLGIGAICLIWGLLVAIGTFLEVRRWPAGLSPRASLSNSEWLYVPCLGYCTCGYLYVGTVLCLRSV
jgi:hypothetical protein